MRRRARAVTGACARAIVRRPRAMAAAVYDSPRHHGRSTNSANMCSVPGCNSPKDIVHENALPHTTSLHAAMKPFSSHAMNSSGHMPMSPSALALSMSPTSIGGYQHHSLPATLLQQSKSQQHKANYYNHYYTNSRQNKRKSAVEMLAESKPFYVKSEAVLDRKQNLGYRNPVPSGPIQKPTSCKAPEL